MRAMFMKAPVDPLKSGTRVSDVVMSCSPAIECTAIPPKSQGGSCLASEARWPKLWLQSSKTLGVLTLVVVGLAIGGPACGEPTDLDDLLSRLGATSPHTKITAIHEVSEADPIEPRLLDSLLELLKDHSRLRIAGSDAAHGFVKGISYFVQSLTGRRAICVSTAAARVLTKWNEQLAGRLYPLLHGEDRLTAAAAAAVIGGGASLTLESRKALIAGMQSNDDLVSCVCARGLLRLGESSERMIAASHLASAMQSMAPVSVRYLAARTLREFGSDLPIPVGPLRVCLLAENAAMRLEVICAINTFDKANALPWILPALTSLLPATCDDQLVRSMAAEFLGEIGPDALPCIPELVRALGNSFGGGSACSAIERIGPSAFPFILAALKDALPSVRAWACVLMARSNCGARILLEQVGPLVSDCDPEVRCRAMNAIGTLGKQGLVMSSAIRKNLSDPDPRVATSAMMALDKIGD